MIVKFLSIIFSGWLLIILKLRFLTFSKRRNRSVARKPVHCNGFVQLTDHSLPEIGEAFGGRDHTTVLHACEKIKELCDTDLAIRDDYSNLLKALTG